MGKLAGQLLFATREELLLKNTLFHLLKLSTLESDSAMSKFHFTESEGSTLESDSAIG